MTRRESSTAVTVQDRPARHRATTLVAAGIIVGTVAAAAAACGGSTSGSSKTTAAAAAVPKTENVTLIGKSDADKGAPGTFTGKEHWPAFAPDTIKVTKGDTIVLNVKEYDSGNTALPAGSPYNAVQGGTETVDGKPVTSVDNKTIAHTITIPELGINIPLPKAPEGGVTNVVFIFKVDKPGTYTWRCFTPCGGGANGMGGSMAAEGWMKGRLIVA